MGMRARVKQYSIIVRTREKKEKVRTKLEQEQIWNGFQGFPYLVANANGIASFESDDAAAASESGWGGT